MDCSDLHKVTGHSTAGQECFLDGGVGGVWFPAYCNSDDWTVIQSRGQLGNPQDYFARNWDEYESGFGEPGM